MVSLLRKTNTQRALSSPCNPWQRGRFGRAAARIWESLYGTNRVPLLILLTSKGTKVDIVVTSLTTARPTRALRHLHIYAARLDLYSLYMGGARTLHK